ncbi:MAG TPA: CoA transferase [Paracoccaceae bacterium]|nr:CoA transferase [Paracoccaceae bacterium]
MAILDGVRVLDFGRYIAGPYCAALLADLGADVVRVERLQGGDDRYLMPSTEQGEGAQFLQCNLGKRCLALDMGTPRGREVMRRLIARADVVVANFSPAALKHFGLDYETLRAIKEDIILTTATAYGSEGALSERIGFDGVGQAVSGAIWLSGVPGHPFRSATAFVDFGTALSCAYGTLAALIAKMRTGRGTQVEVSLAGTGMTIMNQILIEQATGYNERVPTGNRSPISGPSDVFAARDGWFIMQVIGAKMFDRWARLVGRPDLLDDPRFASDILRGRNGEELSRIMSDWAADKTREECLSQLVASGIGCGPVLSPAEVMAGEMGLAQTFLRRVPYPGSNGIPIARAPARLSQGTVAEPARPPRLGEHSDAVLADYGFAADEIAGLRVEGVI